MEPHKSTTPATSHLDDVVLFAVGVNYQLQPQCNLGPVLLVGLLPVCSNGVPLPSKTLTCLTSLPQAAIGLNHVQWNEDRSFAPE